MTNNRHPAVHPRNRSAPDGTARSSPSRSTPGSTRVPTPTAARASRSRSATRRSGRTASRTCTSSRAASTRTCRRPAPSAASARRRPCGPPSGLMDRLAERLGIDPLELRLRNVLRDGDTLLHRRDDARRPLRRVPRAGGGGGRLARGPTRQGPLRAAQGDADAEPGVDRDRGGRATAATRSAARRPRSARARGARCRSSPPSCSASRPPRSGSPIPTPISFRTTPARRRAARPT